MKKLLSFIIMMGLGISISHAENHPDFSLMLENARKGDVEAMCDLGIAYFYGKETLKDPFKAKCWIKRAYDNDSGRAEKIWTTLELWRYSGKCDLTFDDEALPEYSKGDTFKEPVTGMVFVFIPKGCFMMGCHNTRETVIKMNGRSIKSVWMGSGWENMKFPRNTGIVSWRKIHPGFPVICDTRLKRFPLMTFKSSFKY